LFWATKISADQMVSRYFLSSESQQDSKQATAVGWENATGKAFSAQAL